MELGAESIDIGTKRPVVLLHRQDASSLGVRALDRIEISYDDVSIVGIVKLTDDLLSSGSIGITHGLPTIEGPVEVLPAPHPHSSRSISRKLDGVELHDNEIATVVADINQGLLSDVEIGAFVSGSYINGLSLSETTSLTKYMIRAGSQLAWEKTPVVDKHSIGGIAGNRTTPILVSIIAAAGLTIPKTSSRAVTSPAGTADTMDVFCTIEFSKEEIRDIVESTGGCLVWGGAVDLSPVDDELIRAQTPLALDPYGLVIASVLSKKISVGSTHVIIEIPYGMEGKVESLDAARDMAVSFETVGRELGITVECAITRGSQPIGRGIGPFLEARDILAVLDGNGPRDLRRKSIQLADALFDLVSDKVDIDLSTISSNQLLESGAAMDKFREIIAAQHGDPTITVADLQPGSETSTISAHRQGIVADISNPDVNRLARMAGAPGDPAAGVYVHCDVGDTIFEGDNLFTIHAETTRKLERAVDYAADRAIIHVAKPGEVLVERV